MASPGYIAWKLANVISPIALVGGIATPLGGVLPIGVLTGAVALAGAVASLVPSLPGPPGLGSPELDDFFADFYVLPGATLLNFQYAQYPFANQSVAVNALISQPNRLSMMMVCPVTVETGGFAGKLALMTGLQAVLRQHCLAGGTFTVVTESAIFTNLLLEQFRDASGGDTKQKQVQWQWDFYQPLVTLQQAAAAQNAATQALTMGTPGTFANAASDLGGTSITTVNPDTFAAVPLGGA